MRTVIQRVKSARVSVGDRVVGEIGLGLLALVGIASSDGLDDVTYTAGKVRNLRIFEDENGKISLSEARFQAIYRRVENIKVPKNDWIS